MTAVALKFVRTNPVTCLCCSVWASAMVTWLVTVATCH
jgi:hypothetical protein